MKTDLERDEFLVLLEKLRSKDDSIILTTVDDINSKMMVAEVVKVHPWAEPFLTPTEWAAPSMGKALNPKG
jgi:hypothetical protein